MQLPLKRQLELLLLEIYQGLKFNLRFAFYLKKHEHISKTINSPNDIPTNLLGRTLSTLPETHSMHKLDETRLSYLYKEANHVLSSPYVL